MWSECGESVKGGDTEESDERSEENQKNVDEISKEVICEVCETKR